jgi:hypothetical protein
VRLADYIAHMGMRECGALQFYLLDLEEGRHLASRHKCMVILKCILKYTISVLFVQNMYFLKVQQKEM